MEMQRTKNTLGGLLAIFSSHHNDRDVPDGGGSFRRGFWKDTLWAELALTQDRAADERLVESFALELWSNWQKTDSSLFAGSAELKTKPLRTYIEKLVLLDTLK